MAREVALIIRRIGMGEAFAERRVEVVPEHRASRVRAGPGRAEMIGMNIANNIRGGRAFNPRERAMRTRDIIRDLPCKTQLWK